MSNCLLKYILILLVISEISYAQISDSNATVYNPINENLFVNTKWKYTYATHSETNTVIHKADTGYNFFVFFRYDYAVESFINGKRTDDFWKLNKEQNELNYNYRRIKWWRIVSFTEESLILEYTMNIKSSYRYHFIRVEDADAPFIRSPHELPDINVNIALNTQEERKQIDYLSFLEKRGVKFKKEIWAKRKKRKDKREQNRLARLNKTNKGKKKLDEEKEREFMQIEMIGGGYYGGIDPVYRNMTIIKTDGRVVKEYQSELQGLRVSRHYIERDSLESLMRYIEERHFFDFDQIYTCNSPSCLRRLEKKPRPITFRIAITKGVKRKIITIPIWDGKGRSKSLIEYPYQLDDIVRAIENITIPPL